MKVIILRGISGSGKSREAQALLHEAEYKGEVISTDDYFVNDEGTYVFDKSKLNEAHAWCLRTFIEHVRKNHPAVSSDFTLIVDNTNTRIEEAAPYVQIAKAYGCHLRVITLRCDFSLALSRNIHKTPSDVLWAQYQRIEKVEIPPWWNHEVVQV